MQSTFNSEESLILSKDAFINKLVLIFFLNLEIIFLIFNLFFFIFNPPSVVISFLFSGTMQTKFGFISKAFLSSQVLLRFLN